LPGGSIGQEDLAEDTKPTVEAIKREIREETGFEVTDIRVVFTDSWVFEESPGKILGIALGYRAVVMGVKPRVSLSNEHAESLWGTKAELLVLDFGDDGGLHQSIIEVV
jgi:8-oxo-dGTP pyrophosphatase MutT (NUDIX family)